MSVALPDDLVNGKNVDKEIWFHVGSLYLVSLTHTHNRIAAPVASATVDLPRRKE